MSATALKIKINKSLKELNVSNLQSAYLAKGIRELNNGEGTDFMLFLNEMQGSYGKKK